MEKQEWLAGATFDAVDGDGRRDGYIDRREG